MELEYESTIWGEYLGEIEVTITAEVSGIYVPATRYGPKETPIAEWIDITGKDGKEYDIDKLPDFERNKIYEECIERYDFDCEPDYEN